MRLIFICGLKLDAIQMHRRAPLQPVLEKHGCHAMILP